MYLKCSLFGYEVTDLKIGYTVHHYNHPQGPIKLSHKSGPIYPISTPSDILRNVNLLVFKIHLCPAASYANGFLFY